MAVRSTLVNLARLLRIHDRGQGLAEYALILAFIAMIAIAGLLFMGTQLGDQLSVIGSSVDGVTP
jgi:Flp pilus assembly pilin Flp